ncbi:MAG: endolytic transglycosylase MltG [Lachnospiraceae bacterium]|nr:endolytic transglycosylase MltG [Lachnospiraceae bacterium]
MYNNSLEKISRFFVGLAKFFLKLAVFFVVIYLIGIRLFDFGHRLFYERAIATGDGETIVFEIKQGEAVDEIAENLEKAGLIDDTLAFRFRAKIYETNFTPNVYNLNTNMTIKNMLDIFDSPTSDYINETTTSDDVYQLSPEDDVFEGETIEGTNNTEER